MTRLPQTLGKNERMKSRKRIDALFSEGRKMQQFPFRLLYLTIKSEQAEGDTGAVRAGFTASSRNFGLAVDRNRLKRLMRESYRQEKAPLLEAALKTGNRLEMFFIYTGREMSDASSIRQAVSGLIRKLARELNEKHSLPS